MSNNMLNKHYPSTKWFVFVGLLSTLVHYLAAIGFESFNIYNAEYSNLAGYVIAFPVSYFGHKALSFSCQKSGHSKSLPRFIFVSAAGFVSNQTMLILLIHRTSLPFWLSLGLVMLTVSVSTYLLSRFWVFN